MAAPKHVGQRAYFERLHDALDIGAFRVSPDGRVVDANEALCRMLGAVKSSQMLLDASGLPHLVASWRARLDAGRPADVNSGCLVKADGSVLEVEGDLRTVRDDRARLLGFEGYLRDVAELRRDQIESEYRALLLDQVQHAVICTNADGDITLWNKTAERVIGWRAADAIGAGAAELLGGDTLHAMKHDVIRTLKRDGNWQGELACRTADEGRRDLHCRAIQLQARDGSIDYVGIFVDLTGQKALESQLRHALADKERLLSEAHRRVKANLQLVSSLINIQLSRQPDAMLRLVAQEIQNRIRAIALLHELLLQSSDRSTVNMPIYIRQITQYLAQTYAQQCPATVECRGDDLWLGLDVAVRIGLVVNELVVNALKYAFDERSEGTVSVCLVSGNEQSALLEVRDSGIGLPAGAELGGPRSHGLRLVADLASSLGGILHITRDAGTVCRLSFPLPR